MLSVGIVGLPNVGKSTLFNALLKKQQALAANYPFATIEPNIGIVPVPDERLERLADLVAREESGREGDPSTLSDVEVLRTSRPPIVPATVRFVDIAGLVKGASKGDGLGNQFLSHIREVDAVVEVVRNFSDENVIRAGSVSPKEDIEVVNTELILADLQTIQNSKGKIQNDRSKVKNLLVEVRAAAVDKLEAGLNAGELARAVSLTNEEREAAKELQLLTSKPFLYVFNSDEAKVAGGLKGLDPSASDRVRPYNPSGQEGLTLLGSNPIEPLVISAKLEAELSSLSGEDQKDYLKELGITESGLDKVIRSAFNELNLITYFTAGPKEVRAWTINRGDKAPRAAGKIHTDFERGFIAAEVISTEELLMIGSYKKVKELGKLRLEGKTYEVKDGDVVEFRFSV